MRTNHPYLLLFVSAVIIFSSCQKEISTSNGILPGTTIMPTNNSVADSNYLDKIFTIDSSGTSLDSDYIVFNYDGQKRIKNVVIKASPNATDSDFFLKFYYNGNDSLPYFISNPLDPSDYYCYYDNSGKLIRDSVINFGAGSGGTDEIQVAHLSYPGNKIYADFFTSITGPANLAPSYKDTLTLDARGNVIGSDYYFKDFVTGNYNLNTKTVATFDNYRSPYTKVPGFNIYIFAYNIPFENFDNVFTANNELTNTDSYYTTTGGVTSLFDTRLVTYTNTYYPGGFLKKAIGVTTGPYTSGYSNWSYFYRSL